MPLGRGDDVVRGREIGLADAEIDDVLARLGELVGAGEHLERALGAETMHALCEDHLFSSV
jgi:hypothetical protein